MTFRTTTMTAACAAMLLGSASLALAQTTTKSAAAKPPSPADSAFMLEAARGGLGEVALGQAAQSQGHSDAVKQFGARMVDDHTKANDELKAIAAAKNVTLPPTPPKDPAAARLMTLKDDAFDRAYWAKMLADHKKTVALFQKEAHSGRDADVKAFAAKTLPTLQEHLKMVQDQSHGTGTMGAMPPSGHTALAKP